MRFLRTLVPLLASVLWGLACADSNSPGDRLRIRIELTGVSFPAGSPGFSIRVFATAPSGDEVTAVGFRLTGLVQQADSTAFGGERSQSFGWDFPMSTIDTGTITVTGFATTENGVHGTRDTAVVYGDDEPPFIEIVLRDGTRDIQPGDTLKIEFNAHDNTRMRSTSLQISGGLTYADSVPSDTVRALTRLVVLPVPRGTHLGTIQLLARAEDYVGNVSLEPIPLHLDDFTTPTVSIGIGGGHNGLSFAPGDTLQLDVDIHDNYKLAKVGYRISAPGNIGDSLLTSADSSVQHLRIPITPAWVGFSQLTVFAQDSVGLRRSVSRQIAVDSRTRRPIITAGIDTVRDGVFDEKRGKFYMSHPPASIRTIDLASGLLEPSIRLTNIPAGIDLTASGDSLVIGQPDGRVLIASLLTGDTANLKVLAANDARAVTSLRVLGDNTVIFGAAGRNFGDNGLLVTYRLPTRQTDTTIAATDGFEIGRSADRSRVAAGIGGACCILMGWTFDAGSHKWQMTQQQIFPTGAPPSLDYSGDHVMIGTALYSRTLSPLPVTPPAGATGPALLAPDGLSAFWPMATGVVKVRFSDGAVLETFPLAGRPSQLYLSPSGLTLVAVLPFTIAIIDLW